MSHESWAAGSGAPAPQRHTPPSPSSRNATVTMSGVVFMMCAKTSPKRRARSRFTSMGVRNVELKVRHCLIFLGIEATVRIYIAGIISSEFQTLMKEFPECGTAPLFTLTFSMQHFNRESDSLAAKRDQAAPQPVAAHRMDQLGRQHCTGRANRMAMGHGTAFDIDDVLGQPKLASNNDGDGREGFVDLRALNRANVPAGALQGLLDRGHGSQAEHTRFDRRDAVSDQTCCRGKTAFVGPRAVGEHDSRSGIVQSGGVAGGDCAVRTEDRLEPRQC